MIVEYITQVIFFQLAFLLVFEFFLKGETFFNYNRFYLLITPVISILLPFLKFEFLANSIPAESYISLPEIFIGSGETIGQEFSDPAVKTASETINWPLIIYITGAVFSLFLFIKKCRYLIRLKRNKSIRIENNIRIIEIPASDQAFTFMNNIFLGEHHSDEGKQQILAHELVHAKEKHSIDLICFEILKILFWFDPLIYIFQSKITTLHEYIADNEAVKNIGRRSYYEQLLNTAFRTQNISFINQFFNHSLIKKRILMLQKSKSSKISKIRFLLVIPLIMAMLTYVACSDIETGDQKDPSLAQYSYTLKKGDHPEGNPDLNQKRTAHEEFLVNNPDYVSWATIDYDSDQVSYSIHKASEKAPYNYNKMTVSMKNGQEYIMFMNLKATGKNTSKDEYQKDDRNWDDKDAVPYALIEKSPAFSECDQMPGDARRDCTSRKLAYHVNKNFDTSLGKKLGLSGINRVIVKFRINPTGKIDEIMARAAHPDLEAEAKRVISLVPDMIPGEQGGKPVSVMYSLPIAFQVNK